MQLLLTPEAEKLISERMKLGGYRNAEEVILAGLFALGQQQSIGEFDAGEMNRIIAEGESSGEPLDGKTVLQELRQLRSHE